MTQKRIDHLLDALAEGTISASERVELDRLAASDPAVARARDAEMLIGETLGSSAANGPSGPTVPDAGLLARFSAPPAPPIITGFTAALALGAAAIIGVIVGVTLFTPSAEVEQRTVVRHDTIVRLAPPEIDTTRAPSLAAPESDRQPESNRTAQDADRGEPKRPRATAAEPSVAPTEPSRPSIVEPEGDDELIMNPDLQRTDTVRGRARVRSTDDPEERPTPRR